MSRGSESMRASGGRDRSRLVYWAAGVLAVIVLAAVAGGVLLRDREQETAQSGIPSPEVTGGGKSSGTKTAAIIDQLSLTLPNPGFVASATGMLEQAGYLVNYYPGEEVTVDFYRYLPTLDYDPIVLRAHTGETRRIDSKTGDVTWPDYVSIFTGERFAGRDKYPRQGVGDGFTYDGGPTMYAITTGFVEHVMRGRFNDTVIVMMGCDGLLSSRTAQAFLDKGASAYVGWSDAVSAIHTDRATAILLEKFVTDSLSLEQAVAETAYEVGPDPWYGAELRVSPTGTSG